MKRPSECLKPYYFLEPKKKAATTGEYIEDGIGISSNEAPTNGDKNGKSDNENRKSSIRHGVYDTNTTFNIFPRINGESPEQSIKRYEMFQDTTKSIIEEINHILQTSHDDLYKHLYNFCKEDMLNYSTTSSLIQPNKKFQAGYLSLSSNGANNHRILEDFFKIVSSDNNMKIIRIDSKKCTKTIKSVIREVVRQLEEDVDEGGKDEPIEVDDILEDEIDKAEVKEDQSQIELSLIRDWYLSNDFTNIIIFFEDTESIGLQNINLFLKYMFSILDVPIKVIFTLTTSNVSNWISNNINNDFRLNLTNYKFDTKSDKDICFNILKVIIIKSPVLLDSKVVQIILSRFFNANSSIDSVLNEVKLCLMIHFYQNSYSRFLFEDPTVQDVQLLKKLPSFKKHVEYLLYKYKQGDGVSKEDVGNCFSDSYILDQFHQTKQKVIDFKHNFKKVVKALKQDELVIYRLLISNNLFKSKIWKSFLQSKTDSPDAIEKVRELIQVPVVFNEIFVINGGDFQHETPKIVENYDNLMLNLIRPKSRSTLENNLSTSRFYLDNKIINKSSMIEPITVILFNILNEAPPTLNHYDFFNAFKNAIDREKVSSQLNKSLDDKAWDKLILSWFLHICNEFLLIGLIKEKPRGDHFEKSIWRGL